MMKWIWRLFDNNQPNSLWLQLIRAKYPGSYNIFGSTPVGGSQFWHGIHKIKHFFKLGAKFHLGLGDRILF